MRMAVCVGGFDGRMTLGTCCVAFLVVFAGISGGAVVLELLISVSMVVR